MLHVADMRDAANDNSETWIKLAAATANLVRYLQPKETSDPKGGEPEPNPKDDRKTDPDEQRAYIDEGLRRMRRFELPYRAGGKRNDTR